VNSPPIFENTIPARIGSGLSWDFRQQVNNGLILGRILDNGAPGPASHFAQLQSVHQSDSAISFLVLVVFCY
jgi:hypothetical protein